ncbi:hypothetical protein [Helicobacter sp. MIT 14-3879]|uniref:hypothetical protein n=1 Tax=Helicobacter sp. MIT 14-3879 TaxID=2040649 RepID=UPI000E1FA921|nr:hypothetical protein [Helicobacter sp. MIT 14-3879]RDU65163.1 hypothetical protein CQA44_02295 [Helicobacter sp. MIT 14-3879]
MENYLANLTNDLRESNKKLNYENQSLQEEIIKLKEHIKVLEKSDYIDELEFNIKTLQDALKNERQTQQILKNDVESLSKRLDEFLTLFATYINEDEENNIYKINNDKSLMFGVNIDSAFIKNSNPKAIRNYLNILKCNNIQNFIINDFQIQKKSDVILIGEVFADFIRLSNLNNEAHIYGLVEMSMPNVINQNAIAITFYGNKDIKEEFSKFKKIYSNQLNFKDSLE